LRTVIGVRAALCVVGGVTASGTAGARAWLEREEGQAFVEYAIVLLLVAVTLAAGAFVTPFRTALEGAFSSVGGAISGALPG
jgi:Flp pilus assembly pilin Flp